MADVSSKISGDRGQVQRLNIGRQEEGCEKDKHTNLNDRSQRTLIAHDYYKKESGVRGDYIT